MQFNGGIGWARWRTSRGSRRSSATTRSQSSSWMKTSRLDFGGIPGLRWAGDPRCDVGVAQLTAICRKTKGGPLGNEVVRLRAQIRGRNGICLTTCRCGVRRGPTVLLPNPLTRRLRRAPGAPVLAITFNLSTVGDWRERRNSNARARQWPPHWILAIRRRAKSSHTAPAERPRRCSTTRHTSNLSTVIGESAAIATQGHDSGLPS
jgi:hypothetical protein